MHPECICAPLCNPVSTSVPSVLKIFLRVTKKSLPLATFPLSALTQLPAQTPIRGRVGSGACGPISFVLAL
jgi:hypothetical protein